jgi:hypothetical protein
LPGSIIFRFFIGKFNLGTGEEEEEEEEEEEYYAPMVLSGPPVPMAPLSEFTVSRGRIRLDRLKNISPLINLKVG